MPEDHNATNIAEVLSETLQQWKLEKSRLVGITTDSGSNIKAACEINGRVLLSCFGHNFNLAVSKGLNDSCVLHGFVYVILQISWYSKHILKDIQI